MSTPSRTSGENDRGGGLDLLVPAYVHPLQDPATWDRIAGLAPALRAVVVNVHNGPGATGDGGDAAYPPVIEALQRAGARLVGYVDTDYGRRPAADIVADIDLWLARYGVRGVFFDQTTADLDGLDHYAELSVAARARGADYVVLNPGTLTHPGYLDLANVTVTFEGTWRDYRRLEEPEWVRGLPASRFAHLVHEVPGADVPAAVRLARRRHVRSLFVSTGSGANPWDQLPPELVSAVAAPVG